jgi:hypothetical protein
VEKGAERGWRLIERTFVCVNETIAIGQGKWAPIINPCRFGARTILPWVSVTGVLTLLGIAEKI